MTRTVRMLFPRGEVTSDSISAGTATFGADGTLTGTSYTGPTHWFYPTAGGVGAGYWLRLTRLGGTTGVTFGSLQDVWTSLITDLTAQAQGAAGSCNGVWSISTSSTGSPIMASGNISLNNAA